MCVFAAVVISQVNNEVGYCFRFQFAKRFINELIKILATVLNFWLIKRVDG